MAHERLEDNVRESMREYFEATRRAVFVDDADDRTPAGKMKLEGVYDSGIFRTNKTYVLTRGSGAREVKCKGMSGQVRREMEEEQFMPAVESLDREPIFSNWRLGGVKGGDLSMNVTSKRLPSRLNLKRRTLVSSRDNFSRLACRCLCIAGSALDPAAEMRRQEENARRED